MKKKVIFILLVTIFFVSCRKMQPTVIEYLTDGDNLQFTLTAGEDSAISSVKTMVEKKGENLLFATNGGMFDTVGLPVGLYVENCNELKPITFDTNSNFNYTMPFGKDSASNGVFLIDTNGTPYVVMAREYAKYQNVTRFATQSGPLLLYKGEINSKFRASSKNKLLRSGVGITNEGKTVFIIAQDINFFSFAMLFKHKYHCKNALFLDGCISKMYQDSGQIGDLDGAFGVIIFETTKQ